MSFAQSETEKARHCPPACRRGALEHEVRRHHVGLLYKRFQGGLGSKVSAVPEGFHTVPPKLDNVNSLLTSPGAVFFEDSVSKKFSLAVPSSRMCGKMLETCKLITLARRGTFIQLTRNRRATTTTSSRECSMVTAPCNGANGCCTVPPKDPYIAFLVL